MADLNKDIVVITGADTWQTAVSVTPPTTAVVSEIVVHNEETTGGGTDVSLRIAGTSDEITYVIDQTVNVETIASLMPSFLEGKGIILGENDDLEIKSSAQNITVGIGYLSR